MRRSIDAEWGDHHHWQVTGRLCASRQIESKLEGQRKPRRRGAVWLQAAATLVQLWRDRADAHDGGINALLVALLERGLAA